MGDTDHIPTYTGKQFDFECPDADTICIEDIAHHLSLTHRWRGATGEGMSVAQHSVMVAQMMGRAGYSHLDQLGGLMHDAAEAYLGDVPSPLKAKLPDFKAYELVVQNAICDKFGIPRTPHPSVHLFDVESYRWEARDLLHPEHGMEAPTASCRSTLVCWPPGAAEFEFLNLFGYLMEAVRHVATVVG